ncbi:1-deoxy-d-xylulose-5-phosphate synthase (1-deoxyxylulose-5-phosphate synthase) (dxp synthase) (dxps) [Treponema primitia ZAS-2]|uniref:1-deoxy-d-xylulose-5-phosphate synthase (1-deoxyxylulose-5-phosphate synthase) (Dxp synthase) (Dxps) n=1 Tax=Treponema primitia (strain ATCC BAA-887 / DSM 12427 / ZAS-2) TaxID=545694 RepID=F5YN45_TREPZ|nr:transketolase C-terminal domain-containing protein [Treponema primitia]AEF84676.1 1-deoxy-d-xylulose-5-phosphate synthase (1-deoxyxylulose-5-phosphate synthase) (dxp synthase) (dxps) [Treponema primitia ZAS-2]
MRKVFEKYIYDLLGANSKIVFLVSDSDLSEYKKIKNKYPDRFFDFGIAESNMIAISAGFAKEGYIPLVYALNSFLAYRALEFIRDDICLQKRNVKIIGLAAGVIANTLGPTHHSTEDIAALRALPNLILVSPGSPKEVSVVLEKSVDYNGPVYIRLGKAFEREIYESISPFEIGKSTLMSEGEDITIISTGSIIADVIEAAEMLKKDDITAEIINMSTIKPIDKESIIKSALKTKKVITVEEHNVIGGLGCAVSEVLCKAGVTVIFDIMGFNDTFCNDYGWHQDLKRMYGLSPLHIYEKCKIIYNDKRDCLHP